VKHKILNERWPNERNVKENSFKNDYHSRESQEMYLEAEKRPKFQRRALLHSACSSQLFKLKRNSNIIFADGFAVILSAVAIPCSPLRNQIQLRSNTVHYQFVF